MSHSEETWEILYDEACALAKMIPDFMNRAEFEKAKNVTTDFTTKLQELLDIKEDTP